MTEVTLWVLVNEDGEYVVHKDQEGLKDQYEADVGEWDTTVATRMIAITVKVPTPCAVELEAEIAEEPASGELKVA